MTTIVSRRQFLAGSAAVCTIGTVTPLLTPSMAFAADGSTDHTLIVVTLDGGLDGLSALIPAGDPAYGQARSSTVIPDSRAIGVDQMFALHPSLSPLHDHWADGLMAAVPAVGTATRTRSHFMERAVVARGAGGRGGDGTGWLARHLLTQAHGQPETLQAVSTGEGPAPELTGSRGAFHLPDLATTHIGGWEASELPGVEQALATSYAAASDELANAADSAFVALRELRASQASTIENRATYPPDAWSQHLRQVAQLIRADIGLEAAVVNFAGWDTHQGQGGAAGPLAQLLDKLARALAAFTGDLHDRLDQLTIVVVSEFGRRVQENGSGGTDHGKGGVAFILGGGLRGGVHGIWPGVDRASLDDGDLAVATDIRSVFAEVVRGRLGNPALDRVFPNFTPVPLGFA